MILYGNNQLMSTVTHSNWISSAIVMGSHI